MNMDKLNQHGFNSNGSLVILNYKSFSDVVGRVRQRAHVQSAAEGNDSKTARDGSSEAEGQSQQLSDPESEYKRLIENNNNTPRRVKISKREKILSQRIKAPTIRIRLTAGVKTQARQPREQPSRDIISPEIEAEAPVAGSTVKAEDAEERRAADFSTSEDIPE